MDDALLSYGHMKFFKMATGRHLQDDTEPTTVDDPGSSESATTVSVSLAVCLLHQM